MSFLARQRRHFAADVAQHLAEHVPAEERARWRELAKNRARWVHEAAELPKATKPAELVAEIVSDDGVSVSALLGALGPAERVGLVDGEPVLWWSRSGVYAWSTAEDRPDCLAVWLTWPAYPPGWH